MKLALIAAPSPSADADQPALGQRDADLVADRLGMSDLGFEVIRLDPDIDLAAQVDETLSGIDGDIEDLVVYASCQLAIVDEEECFLCLVPSEPDVGDAVRDVASAVTERAERVLLVTDLRHQDRDADHATVRAAATALQEAVQPSRLGIELIVAIRPTDAHIERIPSRLTVGLLESLDQVDGSMSAKRMYAKAAQTTDLGDWPTGLVYSPASDSVQMRDGDNDPISERLVEPLEKAATPSPAPEVDAGERSLADESFPNPIEPKLSVVSAAATSATGDDNADADGGVQDEDLPKVVFGKHVQSQVMVGPADETRPSQRLLAEEATQKLREAEQDGDEEAPESIPVSFGDEESRDSIPVSVDSASESERQEPAAEGPASEGSVPMSESSIPQDAGPISIDAIERFSDPGQTPAPPGPPPPAKRPEGAWPRKPASEMTAAEKAIADFVDAGDAAVKGEDFATAVKNFKRALGRFGTASTPERAQVYLRIGRVLQMQGKRRVAISNIEKALAITADDPAAIETLINLYAEQKNWRSVASVEERYIDAAEPNEESFERLLAFGDRWLNDADDQKRALARYELAADWFEDRTEPLEKLAALYSKSGDGDRALQLRRDLAARAETPRERAEMLYAIGVECEQLGRDEEALEAMENALEEDPSFLSTLERLASRLGEDQEWGELERIYQKAYDALVREEPSRDERRVLAEIQHRMALLYRDHLDDPGSALAALDRSLEHRPRQVGSLLLASEVARELDDPAQALVYLRKVTDLEPERVQTYHRMFELAAHYEEPHTMRFASSVTVVMADATDEEAAANERLRTGGVPGYRKPMSPKTWKWLRTDADTTSYVDGVMAALAPTVLRYRVTQLAASGKLPDVPSKGRQDPKSSTLSVVRSMAWAAQYLGKLTLPALYVSDKHAGAIDTQLGKEQMSIMGKGVLSGRSLPELAFLSGRHLVMRRPEAELIAHMQSIDELSVCFLAGLKIVLGTVPTSGDMAKTVESLARVLVKHQTPEEHQELKLQIARFSEAGGQANLHQWVAETKLVATRAGFVLCGDLQTAVSLLKDGMCPGLSERDIQLHVTDLCRFAVSGAFLKICKSMA